MKRLLATKGLVFEQLRKIMKHSFRVQRHQMRSCFILHLNLNELPFQPIGASFNEGSKAGDSIKESLKKAAAFQISCTANSLRRLKKFENDMSFVSPSHILQN